MKNKKFFYKSFFVAISLLVLNLGKSLNSQEIQSDIKIKSQKIEKKQRSQKIKEIRSSSQPISLEKNGILSLNSFGLEGKIASDQKMISKIFHHSSKHEWNIANRDAKTSRNETEFLNFIALMKFANCSKSGLSFNEGYIFNFLSNKYGILNNEFIVSKINKASPNFLNNVNENNITQSGLNSLPSNLIARFKKNHSLINDSGFVSSVKKTWHTKKFSSPQSENQFFEVFKRVITKMDHDLRLENMIWDGNFDAANRIFNKASVGKKSQLQNRIRILRASSLNEVQSIVNSLKNRNSQEYQTSIFDAIRWCEYNKIDNKKFEFLSQASNFKNLNQHWAKLFKQSRRELLSSNNPKFIQLAYYSASNHSEKPRTTDFVEAEFLAGFIAFKFLGQNQKAIEHFYQSYKNAENHNRISRGAYWIGLVLRKGGGTRSSFFDSKQLNEPLYWFSIGSRNFTSFYGQLCAFEIDQNSNPIQKYLAQIDSKSISNVKNHQLFSYYYYSLLTKNFDLSSKIAKIFTLSLRSKSEIAAIAQLANILNMPLVSIHIGNVAKKHLNLTLIEALYPTPHYNNLKYNKALVYSIIHKESAFDHKVSGLAGEFGLMQIMPDTASKLSKQLGVHINGRNLYDPHLNSLLGSQYIKNLQNRFNGFSLLSIGAYNAGENVVERWISSYGDPRNSRSHYDIVSWIESTSFKTTRYYMQTVMANYLIYQTILNSEHKSNLGKMLFH